MGKSEAQPASGLFVRRQFKALKDINDSNLNLSYFELPKKALKESSSAKRYYYFLNEFIKQFVFSKNKIDLIHIHFFFPTIILAIFYKVFRNPSVKIVTTFHGSDIYHYESFKWWYKCCFSFVDHSIFVSDRLKNRFYKQGIPHDVLSAGVLGDFKPDNNIKPHKYDFIFVGTLDKNKGTFRLKKLIETMPSNFRIAVVGAGTEEAEITSLLNMHNIEYFSFCDAQKLVALYQESKWLINLSHNESFGLVMSEAMACGVPVIASKTDGSMSQVLNNENGCVFEQNDALIQNILSYINDVSQKQYQNLKNGALKSSQKIKLSYIAEKIQQIYHNVRKGN